MLTYPWKCTVLHCNHLGNTWKPLVLMTRHFDYCPSASEGDNQSVRSSAPVVSRCFPGGYNVKLYISRGRLAWWLLAFLHSVSCWGCHRSFLCGCIEKQNLHNLNIQVHLINAVYTRFASVLWSSYNKTHYVLSIHRTSLRNAFYISYRPMTDY